MDMTCDLILFPVTRSQQVGEVFTMTYFQT